MRIGAKIGTLVCGLLVGQVLVLGAGGYLLVSEADAYRSLVRTSNAQLTYVAQLNDAYLRQSQAFDRMVLHSRAFQGESNGAQYSDRQDAFYGSVSAVDKLIADEDGRVSDPGLRAQVSDFDAVHEQITNIELAQLNEIRAGVYDPANSDVNDTDQQARELVTAAMSAAQAKADEAASARVAASHRIALLGALLALAIVITSAVAALLIVRRIVGPIRLLTGSARQAADRTLPDTVAQVRRARGEVSAPAIPPITSHTHGDELDLLARAMNSLQSRAVALAVEQRRADLANAETLVNIGRRNQSLLTRTLGYVGQLERDERDPDVLAQLFRLDHLTTRIRRNAESMLVLAGAEQSRTHTKPLSTQNVVRAALSEIEDYERVEILDVESAPVLGACAADISHLLAELLENGARFSPASTTITVQGQRIDNGYEFVITDRGLGLSNDELAALNRRISEAEFVRVSSKRLGLHIVGRLAARRGITVTLANGEPRGVVATVNVPSSVLSTAKRRPSIPRQNVASRAEESSTATG